MDFEDCEAETCAIALAASRPRGAQSLLQRFQARAQRAYFLCLPRLVGIGFQRVELRLEAAKIFLQPRNFAGLRRGHRYVALPGQGGGDIDVRLLRGCALGRALDADLGSGVGAEAECQRYAGGKRAMAFRKLGCGAIALRWPGGGSTETRGATVSAAGTARAAGAVATETAGAGAAFSGRTCGLHSGCGAGAAETAFALAGAAGVVDLRRRLADAPPLRRRQSSVSLFGEAVTAACSRSSPAPDEQNHNRRENCLDLVNSALSCGTHGRINGPFRPAHGQAFARYCRRGPHVRTVFAKPARL